MNKALNDFFSKDYYFGMKNSNYLNYGFYDNDRFWRPTIAKVVKYKMSGRVLDVGCAFGFLLKRLKNNFTELHGIDISEYALERAKNELPAAKLQNINIETNELLYADGYFDLITAFDVLEHTKSLGGSLEKLVAKLRVGGYLIMSVPVGDSSIGKIFRLFDKDRSHASILSREEIFKIIDSLNLKIIEKDYFLNLAFLKLKGVPLDIEFVLQKK